MTLRPAHLVPLLILVLACDGEPDAPPTLSLSGTALLNSAGPGEPLLVVVQTLDARTLGVTPTDTEGRYRLSIPAPEGVERLLVGALLPAEPGRRALAVIDVGGSNSGAALKASEPSYQLDLDERSTAATLVLATTGDLRQQMQALQQRYASEIELVGQAWAGAPISVCSAPASGTTGGNEMLVNDVLRQIAENHPIETGSVSLMQRLFALSGEGGSVEARLRAMQAAASESVWSGNAPRLTGNVDFLLGLLGVPLARAALAAREGEEFFGGIREDDLSQQKLRRLATIVGQHGWGNCREKAYLGAYIASLVPEIKQIAVVGVGRHGLGDHAMAVACLDGPEVYDLTDMWATDSSQEAGYSHRIPAGVEGRCWVVDPWLGPASAPTAGHVGAFSRDYVNRYKWHRLVALRRVLFEQRLSPLQVFKQGGDPRIFHCSGDGGCEPFTLTPAAPQPDAAIEPQALDASLPPDAAACPSYPPDGISCGASLDGCSEGYYCSRETIACEQEICPPGSGRTYTLECCCSCWGDTSVVDVYDPCRPGFLLRCDAAP